MNYQVLKQLIADQSGDSQQVAEWCNTPSVETVIESFQTTRSLMANIGADAADTFLSQLETAAESIPVVGRTLKLLNPSEGGVDVGLSVVRVQLDQLVMASLVDGDIAAAVKGLANKLVTPAHSVGLSTVLPGDVECERTL